ncbi:hypothetical protein [Streptomyces xanthochromogenes]|uniref:hypothetical protein n=1 Tax=Streptomyces xanthochromogenes TaxID=67384 RepID=UPI002F41648B
MGIAMPSEAKLQPGPLRDLIAAVHDLYVDAAMPGTSRISRLIRERNDLPDTVSHEMVGKLLHGETLPRWEKLHCVVQQLCDMAVSRPAADDERIRFHSLWLAAQRDRDRRPPRPAAKPSSVLLLEARDAGVRTDPEMRRLRSYFQEIWSDVLGERRTLRSEDRGDGWAFWESGTDFVRHAYGQLLPAVAERLHSDGKREEAGQPLRLRGSLHLAEVFTTESGVHGQGMIEAARLLDAPVVRSAVADAVSEVAIAVSAQARDAAGLREDLIHCQLLGTSEFKGWTGDPAWLYIPRPWWPDWKL